MARLGFAIAHLLDDECACGSGLAGRRCVPWPTSIAQALKKAQRPLVISGPSCNNEAVIQAAANVARALCMTGLPAGLSFTMPECNSFGLALMGGAPLSQAFKAVRDGAVDAIVILENDLYRRAPAQSVDAFLSGAKHVIVLDHLLNQTAERATLAIPAGTFAEADGTLVSSEGRAQRFYQVFVPEGDIQASWQWLRDVMAAAGRQEGTRMGAYRRCDRGHGCGHSCTGPSPASCAGRNIPDRRRESTSRAGTLQRAHGHAGEHQRARAQAAG